METIQLRTVEMRNTAMDALMALISDIQRAQKNGAPAAQLEVARAYHRKAQWLVDFVMSENSTGFHATQEAARILTLSIDDARRGQLALRGIAPAGASVAARLPAGNRE